MAGESFTGRLQALWDALWQVPEPSPPPVPRTHVLNTEQLLRERAHADAIENLDQPRPLASDAEDAVRLLSEMPIFHLKAWLTTARILRAAGVPERWPALLQAMRPRQDDLEAQVWVDWFRLHQEARATAKVLMATLDEDTARSGLLRIHGQWGDYPYVLHIDSRRVHVEMTAPGVSYAGRYLVMLDAPSPNLREIAAWPVDVRAALRPLLATAQACHVDEGLVQLWATVRSADRMAVVLDLLEAFVRVAEALPSEEDRLLSMLATDPDLAWRVAAAQALLTHFGDLKSEVLTRILADWWPQVRVVGARYGRAVEPWVTIAADPSSDPELVTEALIQLKGHVQLANAVALMIERGVDVNGPADAWVFDAILPFAKPEHEAALLHALQRAKATAMVVLALGDVATVAAVPALLALKGRHGAPEAVARIQERAGGLRGAVSLVCDDAGGLSLPTSRWEPPSQ